MKMETPLTAPFDATVTDWAEKDLNAMLLEARAMARVRQNAGSGASLLGVSQYALSALAGTVSAHAVSDDPKVATIDRGEDVLICLADMARFRASDAQPAR